MTKKESGRSLWPWSSALEHQAHPSDQTPGADGGHHHDRHSTYFGPISSQLLPQQWINCQIFTSTSSGTDEQFLIGDSWNTPFSKRSVPSTSLQHVCAYAVCNPSCHVIHLTTSCPHNCVCYSWPVQMSPFEPPSAKRLFLSWALSIMCKFPSLQLLKLLTVWDISSLKTFTLYVQQCT